MEKLPHKLTFKSNSNLKDIENFLEKHCLGDWNIELANFDAEEGANPLKVMFELERDKSRISGILSGAQSSVEQRDGLDRRYDENRREEITEWNPIFERRLKPERRINPDRRI